MLVFCEECGTRHEIILNSGEESQVLQCTMCNDTMSVRKNAITFCDSQEADGCTAYEDLPPLNFNDESPRAAPTVQGSGQVNLLIVDDSKMIRKAIREIVKDHDRIQVVGEAANGQEALELIPRVNPDVITLDVNMPVMDGITALKHIMIKYPRPTLMLSALTHEGAKITFDALKFGAVDFIRKPKRLGNEDAAEQEQLIINKILLAADIEIGMLRYLRPQTGNEAPCEANNAACRKIVAIGGAEGAFSALLKIIPRLDPHQTTAYLFMLYEAPEIIEAFINYLGQDTPMKIRQPLDGEALASGVCYLASCHNYVTFDQRDGDLTLQINPNPFPKRRGAINMLMMSLAESIPNDAIGVLLTGSGQDGVEGMAELNRVGAQVIVQEPRTCLCKDMSRTAISQLQSVNMISDTNMASAIKQLLASGNGTAAVHSHAAARP